MMVTSLALTADFIGGNVESSGNKYIKKCFLFLFEVKHVFGHE
jgi:hypothetical protein